MAFIAGNEPHNRLARLYKFWNRMRWQAGYDYVKEVIAREPWDCEVDALTGVVIHQAEM